MKAGVMGALSLWEVFDIQRQRVVRGEYQVLGQLEWVTLGGDAGQPTPPWSQIMGRSIDWHGTGPLLGISLDHAELLICSQVPHPPDIPDPRAPAPLASSKILPWDGTPCRTVLNPHIGERGLCGGKHPTGACQPNYQPVSINKVQQHYRDFTKHVVQGSNFLEFTPVLLVHYFESPIQAIIEGFAGPDGRHLTLFIDPKTGEGHFACGVFRLRTARSARQDAQASHAGLLAGRRLAV